MAEHGYEPDGPRAPSVQEELALERPSTSSFTGRISNKCTLADTDSEVFCLRFSPDDTYLAAACADGAILVYNTGTGRRAFVLNSGHEKGLPTTMVRWRPQQSLSKTRNVLVSINASGQVQHWHVSSGKCLQTVTEEDNQLLCMDYAMDGSQFAVAGKRPEVHVYDEHSKTLTQVLKGGDLVNTTGHANRVFSLKYHPTLRSCLVSGGWDSTVQLWDLREGHAVRSISGPHLCGDSLDVSQDGGTILTGSWRAEQQLQLWDFRSERLLETLCWPAGTFSSQPCLVYAAQFSKDNGSMMIAAGGSGANQAKLFDRRNGEAAFCTVEGLTSACYTVDFSGHSSMLAVGGGAGCVRLVNVHVA